MKRQRKEELHTEPYTSDVCEACSIYGEVTSDEYRVLILHLLCSQKRMPDSYRLLIIKMEDSF